MKKLILSSLISLAIGAGEVHAQTSSSLKYPTLDEKVSKANAIIEGFVVSTRGFENEEKTAIYTSATIRISKIFKGTIADSTIELVFEGGMYNGKRQILTHSFAVDKGNDGIFFIKANTSTAVWVDRSYSYIHLMGTSGYIKYHHDSVNHPATCPGGVFYADLEKDLFQAIEAITKVPRKTLAPNIFERMSAKGSK